LKTETDFVPYLGAEAKVEMTNWRGNPAIRKFRLPKPYRHSELDDRLRKRRTREEALLMHWAKKAGVLCPQVLFADEEESEIIMSYIRGDDLKEAQHSWRSRDLNLVYRAIGSAIGRLHKAGIIHGDLTSKNLIVRKDEPNKPALIDFGLSFVSSRSEDQAEDLHLLQQAFLTTLESIDESRKAFRIVMSGYRSVVGDAGYKKIESQIAEIVKRGRYARVD
jgi:TP53 regulating kinase-like protein